MWVDPDGQILHEYHMPEATLLPMAPNLDLEGSKNFCDTGWALLVEGSAHILKI